MVLVFQDDTDGVMTEIEARRKEQRRIFEQNLLAEGIQMELEAKESSFDGKTNFLKLHIPWKTKIQYAECMNLKLPTKRLITISVKAWVHFFTFFSLLFCPTFIFVFCSIIILVFAHYLNVQNLNFLNCAILAPFFAGSGNPQIC